MRLAGNNIHHEQDKRQLVIMPLSALTPDTRGAMSQSTSDILADAGLAWQRDGGSVELGGGTSRKRTAKGKSIMTPEVLVCTGSDDVAPQTPKGLIATKRLRAPSSDDSDKTARRINDSEVCNCFIC